MSTQVTPETPTPKEPKPVLGDRFESCEVCGAPLDHKQRYCVSCAAKRSDPSNPTSRYFAAASRRSRQSAAGARPSKDGGQLRAAVVLLLILLPAAVGIGVLVGRGGTGSTDPDLLAALDKQAAAGAAASTDTSENVSATELSSDFSLDKGYSVQIDSLPATTTQDDADSATSDAESSGAKDVGIIVPSDFVVKPDPGGEYVVYSGEFKSKGDATKALSDLKSDFPDAKVIQVTAAGGSAGGNTDPTDGAGGETIAKTKYGDVHKIEGIQPTEADQEEGAQIAQDQANQTGQSYIESQQNLPDVIAVGDAP